MLSIPDSDEPAYILTQHSYEGHVSVATCSFFRHSLVSRNAFIPCRTVVTRESRKLIEFHDRRLIWHVGLDYMTRCCIEQGQISAPLKILQLPDSHQLKHTGIIFDSFLSEWYFGCCRTLWYYYVMSPYNWTSLCPERVTINLNAKWRSK
jgi:hypothetical protein